jgi:hypothetical protein
MKSIGGYFELELNVNQTYHRDALKLNTGRNAFQLILKNINCSKFYLPFYTCESVIDSLIKLSIPFNFYHINLELEPEFDYSIVKSDEYFLYTNYFGLKDDFIGYLRQKCINLIIDNSQSFYSMPITNTPTFYSARKFFGVPDGAYLYANIPLKEYDSLQNGSSYERFNSLIKRIDLSAEEGYLDFQFSEEKIKDLRIEKMSKLTEKILSSINYERVADKRCGNFSVLAESLDKYNDFNVNWNGIQIPMVYPFLTQRSKLRSKLFENKIYTASYWPNVLKNVCKTSYEFFIANNFIFLPIDQRYSKEDMELIIKVLK